MSSKRWSSVITTTTFGPLAAAPGPAEEPAAAAEEAAVPAGQLRQPAGGPVAGHRAEHVHLRRDAVDVAAVRTDGHAPDLVERAAADASPAAPSLADAAHAARLLAEHSRRPVTPQDLDGVTDRGRRVHVAPVARDGEVYGSGEPAPGRAALATAPVGDAARCPLRLGQALGSLRQHADGAAPHRCDQHEAAVGADGHLLGRGERTRGPAFGGTAVSHAAGRSGGLRQAAVGGAVEHGHPTREAPPSHVDVGPVGAHGNACRLVQRSADHAAPTGALAHAAAPAGQLGQHPGPPVPPEDAERVAAGRRNIDVRAVWADRNRDGPAHGTPCSAELTALMTETAAPARQLLEIARSPRAPEDGNALAPVRRHVRVAAVRADRYVLGATDGAAPRAAVRPPLVNAT